LFHQHYSFKRPLLKGLLQKDLTFGNPRDVGQQT
jgi:hypothetical protein